jgi:hypothetical protein
MEVIWQSWQARSYGQPHKPVIVVVRLSVNLNHNQFLSNNNVKKHLGVLRATSGYAFRAVVRFFKWAGLIKPNDITVYKNRKTQFPKQLHILFSIDDPIANMYVFTLLRSGSEWPFDQA